MNGNKTIGYMRFYLNKHIYIYIYSAWNSCRSHMPHADSLPWSALWYVVTHVLSHISCMWSDHSSSKGELYSWTILLDITHVQMFQKVWSLNSKYWTIEKLKKKKYNGKHNFGTSEVYIEMLTLYNCYQYCRLAMWTILQLYWLCMITLKIQKGFSTIYLTTDFKCHILFFKVLYRSIEFLLCFCAGDVRVCLAIVLTLSM